MCEASHIYGTIGAKPHRCEDARQHMVSIESNCIRMKAFGFVSANAHMLPIHARKKVNICQHVAVHTHNAF